MQDDNQIFIPDSFIALHLDTRKRLTIRREALAERYEFCEDMAQMLTDHAQAVHFKDGVNEGEILRRCREGLLAKPSTVEPSEANWVVHRTAELLNWPTDELDGLESS